MNWFIVEVVVRCRSFVCCGLVRPGASGWGSKINWTSPRKFFLSQQTLLRPSCRPYPTPQTNLALDALRICFTGALYTLCGQAPQVMWPANYLKAVLRAFGSSSSSSFSFRFLYYRLPIELAFALLLMRHRSTIDWAVTVGIFGFSIWRFVTCMQQLLPQPLITGAWRLRSARVTLGASGQCIYRGQLLSWKLSSSLPSLVSSNSAIYKANYSRILYVPSHAEPVYKRLALSWSMGVDYGLWAGL
jgi:hypothetical protein